MPKHDTALTKPRTQPGQSYLIPEGRVISFGVDDDGSNPIIVLAIDPLEAALMERAAREVVKMTFPRSKADVVLPIGEKDDAPCLYASGQFPTVIRDAANQTIESVEAGTLVRFRVMLKAYRIEGRIEVCAFPSRLDVLPVSAALVEKKEAEPVQIAMTLELPDPPVTDPRTMTLAERRKLAMKAGCVLETLNQKKLSLSPAAFWDWIALREAKVAAKAAKALPKRPPAPFTKATWARHRAALVEERAPAKVKPKPKPKAPETAPALPSNVIPFPVKFQARS